MNESPEGLKSRSEQRVAHSRLVIVESRKRIKVARDHIDRSLAVMAQTQRRMADVRVVHPRAC